MHTVSNLVPMIHFSKNETKPIIIMYPTTGVQKTSRRSLLVAAHNNDARRARRFTVCRSGDPLGDPLGGSAETSTNSLKYNILSSIVFSNLLGPCLSYTNLIGPLTATDHGKRPISAMCQRARAMQAQGRLRIFAVYRVCTPSASLFRSSAQVPSGHHRWEK